MEMGVEMCFLMCVMVTGACAEGERCVWKCIWMCFQVCVLVVQVCTV